ncbi:hypothetical protein GWI33_011395 [Rhynchophorus ferrugineus]|uniref:Uncharacterized protein n=1 Tax=Rhynchophorus ferrugineus TaxID=354439 RepID=A0A834MJ91_RHYFE|nr:hypothetical protein GWI33_011395 [Rhynchophorus ferrugineus]
MNVGWYSVVVAVVDLTNPGEMENRVAVVVMHKKLQRSSKMNVTDIMNYVIVSRQTPKSKINTNKNPTKERDMLLVGGGRGKDWSERDH